MLFTDGLANVGPTTAIDIINEINKVTLSKIESTEIVSSLPTYQQYIPSIPSWLGNMLPKSLPWSSTNSVTGQQVAEENEEKKLEQKKSNDSLKFTINTFGFGNNHNENLLQAIAENGRGMYVFIKNTELIAKTFAECLGGLVSTVAQNIELRLEMLDLPDGESASINKCLSIGVNTQIIKEKKIFVITIPDIQSEEHRDILFDIALPQLKSPSIPWTFAKLTCTFINILKNNTKDTTSIDIKMDRSDNGESGERDCAIDLQHNRIVTAQAMKHADEEAAVGRFDVAQKILSDAKQTIGTSKTNQELFSEYLIKDIDKCANGLQNKADYLSYGSKVMKTNAACHMSQRSVQTCEYASQEAYQTKSKKSMIKKFGS